MPKLKRKSIDTPQDQGLDIQAPPITAVEDSKALAAEIEAAAARSNFNMNPIGNSILEVLRPLLPESHLSIGYVRDMRIGREFILYVEYRGNSSGYDNVISILREGLNIEGVAVNLHGIRDAGSKQGFYNKEFIYRIGGKQ